MTLHEILKMGDPRLLRVAQPVERFATPELRTLVADMFETMRSVNGAGLAAPQIGVDLQLVIFGFKRNERYPDAPAVPETVLLNPVIEPLDDVEEEGWEGCLSVPGLRGVVPRWARIRYRGVDVDGLPIDREAEGFHARVVQHECDHLRGILYPMRVRDFGRFGYTSVLFPTWIPPPTTDCALAARAPLVRSPCKGTCRARRPVGTASATSVDDIDDRDAPARGRIEAETTMTTSNGRTSAQASTRWGWGRLDAMLVLAAFLGLGVLPAKAQTASGGDPPSRVARLSDVAGQVWIYNDETAEWQTVERNRPLTTGDRIATDSGARAEITLGSTTLRLDAATEILVAQLDDRRYVVQLATGSVAARLRSPQALSEFELDTDEGHFRVQTVGRYRFDRFEQTSEVTVFNGQAAYEAKTTGLPVYTGQHAQFWIDAAGAPQYAMIAPARDAFASWNDERDRNEDRIVATGDRFVSPEMTGAEDLGRYGQWQQTPDYGPVWIPTSVPADWAPYSAGHWAFVRPWGWTWVDDAPWGFAPFHYGRWVYQRNAWCWAPGTYVARPVYAPALVAWIGGPRVGVSISIGGGGPPVGWVPLAPREVYVPSYRASPRYVQQVNITHVTNITNITTIVENRNGAADRRDFANRRFPHAVTFVPSDVMTRRQPVGPAAARYRNDPQVRALVADPRPAPSLNAPPVAAPVVPSRPSTGGPAPRPPFEGRDRGGFAGRPDAGRPGDRPGERPGMQPGTQPTPVGPVATPRPIGAPSTVVGPATSPAPVGAPATAVGPVTSPQPVGAPQGTAPRNDRFGRGGAPIDGGPGRGGREGGAPAEQARPPVAQPPIQSAPQLQQQPQQQPQQPQQQAQPQPQPQRMTIPTPIQRATQANDVGRVAPALRGREGAAVEPRAAPIAVPQAVAPAPPIAAPQAQQPPQQEMRRPERIAPPRPVEAPKAAEVARPAPQVAEPRPVESARPATAEQRTNRPEAPRPREERRDDKRDDKPDRR